MTPHPNMAVAARSRKDRRKQERSNKKKQSSSSRRHLLDETVAAVATAKTAAEESVTTSKRRRSASLSHQAAPKPEPATRVPSTKQKRRRTQEDDEGTANKSSKRKFKNQNSDEGLGIPGSEELQAAIRRDDEEIAALEEKLGLKTGSKAKNRLYKEYSKLEGFGDDFGEFLDDLDGLVDRLERGGGGDHHSSRSRSRRQNDHNSSDDSEDDETNSDSDMESKEESKEGEGDESDSSVMDHSDIDEDEESAEARGDDDRIENDEEDGSEEDETLPMKDSSHRDARGKQSSQQQQVEEEEEEESSSNDGDRDDEDDESSESMKSAEDDEKDEDEDDEGSAEENRNFRTTAADKNPEDTYRPTKGEDIYGNRTDSKGQKAQPTKYVPPHLRNKGTGGSSKDREAADDQEKQKSLQLIHRSLNGALNRLSEDTLVPVAQTVSSLYASHPKANVNDCVWSHLRQACVSRSATMLTDLLPVYVATLVGVHTMKGDAAQLGELLLELAVTELWGHLKSERKKQQEESTKSTMEENEGFVAKEASNLTLVVSYLYNFGVVHCSLLFEIVRDLIASFHEVDVEVLLILLNHSGRSLRSDDPSALKEIVLSVQKRALEWKKEESLSQVPSGNASRVDYMVSAMMDLKNNKRRKQDNLFQERTSRLRKLIGRIKSAMASSNGNVRSSDSSLKISLEDILNADTKGRWWKIGASWIGNQYAYNADGENETTKEEEEKARGQKLSPSDQMQDKLIQLAAKYRMNTDTRRAVFCIIMGSEDYQDAFEKLVRAGMLKNRVERDTVRVLLECCGNESAYNQFYDLLAHRICEYQAQCKFSLQLSFWDVFKQFEEMKQRKVANLAKLLFALVVQHRDIKLNVLKAIDMASPDELSEMDLIFLTIFFSNVMDYFDDPSDVDMFFKSAVARKQNESEGAGDPGDLGHATDGEALQASFTLFFVQVLKKSPKYKKGSNFRANLKGAIKSCDSENFF